VCRALRAYWKANQTAQLGSKVRCVMGRMMSSVWTRRDFARYYLIILRAVLEDAPGDGVPFIDRGRLVQLRAISLPSVFSLLETFKTITALNIKITLYWDVTPCSLEADRAASICRWKKHVNLIGQYVSSKLHVITYLKVIISTDFLKDTSRN
jgi:hypothetical protein